MSSRIFRNAEQAFHAWLEQHPTGFVVNTTARHTGRYFILHRAVCSTLHRHVAPGGHTERDYIKACSADATPISLELWIRQIGGPGFTKICAVCKPVPALRVHDPLPDSVAQFAKEVQAARQLGKSERARRLRNAATAPSFCVTTTITYARSPYVAAEVLERARGMCEACGRTAPFTRRSDGTPYLEVHHQVRLADGGHDTVENAIALCPNCHRKAHFGVIDE